MKDTARAHLVLDGGDVGQARRQVIGALAAAGFEVTRRSAGADGFRLTGVHGDHVAALLGTVFFNLNGHFFRSRVDVLCRRDLEGGSGLHLYLGVGPLHDVDDGDELNWITRDEADLVGDALQSRWVLRRVVKALEQGVEAPPEAERPQTKEERRAGVEARIRAGDRRRTIRILAALAVLVAYVVLGALLWLARV